MNNTVKIVLRDNEKSDSDILNLIHLAFEERRLQGLHFTCIDYTLADIQKKASKAKVYLAYINESLVGCLFFRVFTKSDNYGYIEALSVHPNFKGRGIMGLLFNRALADAKSLNLEFIKSDTSVDAHSSVNWHIKNGFKKVKLISSPKSNYYSYVFRKQLKSPSLWNVKVFTDLLLICSSIKCRLTRDRYGKYTLIGNILKKKRK